MSFKYFGATAPHAVSYAKFRPSPPKALIQEIVNFVQKELTCLSTAVDVGCGSGQSTAIFASFFQKVVGLDPSNEIIKEANRSTHLSNVEFRVSGAESLPFADQSVELINAVQAIHWFDLPSFYGEVDRVLKKKGVLAICGYNLPEPLDNDGRICNIIHKYYTTVLKDYVLDGSRKVYLENYSTPEFNQVPFVDDGKMIRKEGFSAETSSTIADLTGYVSTWSGFQNFVKQRGEQEAQKVLDRCQQELCEALGQRPEGCIRVRYRYFLLIGRKA